jgi:PAS domain S-box-containing protein
MSADPRGVPERFRWQALFQRCDEPLFVLNRRRRILFVNRAWEKLTGLPAGEARALLCRNPDPATLHSTLAEMIAHALTPPPEVMRGDSARVRRLLPGREAERRWWDVEFTPLRDAGEVFAVLGRIVVAVGDAAAAPAPLPERLANLRQRAAERFRLDQMPTERPALRRLADQVRLLADLDAPVLLLGEPGVGKQTLAHRLHVQSRRCERAFAFLDCARLPPTALEAVLSADAALGTVYLREPTKLPRDVQLRLCSLLSAAEGPRPRIVSGCSVDPVAMVKSARVLDEFYHLLSPFTLTLPPLRERRADLPWLVEQMLQRLNERGGAAVQGLTPDAWELVNAYAWPGNLRELFDALASAQQRATGERLSAAEFPAPIRLQLRLQATPGRPPEQPLALDKVLEDVERRMIELALRRCNGNKTKAAQYLAIWKPRLLRRMVKLGLLAADEEAIEEAQEDL